MKHPITKVGALVAHRRLPTNANKYLFGHVVEIMQNESYPHGYAYRVIWLNDDADDFVYNTREIDYYLGLVEELKKP
jgi:hypothetical protein